MNVLLIVHVTILLETVFIAAPIFVCSYLQCQEDLPIEKL